MSQPRENSFLQQHINALSDCRDGKPTEGVLMRFNEKEFYLLNLAAQLAASKGYASRQAWMLDVMLRAIQDELENTEATQALVAEFLKKQTE